MESSIYAIIPFQTFKDSSENIVNIEVLMVLKQFKWF